MATKRKGKTAQTTKTEILERVDEKLVEDAVVEIKNILNQTLHKAVTSVGDYVFLNFFNGDPELVGSKDPHKSISFRALAERCGDDIPISRAWLHAAVRVAVIRKALPDKAAFRALPPTHQAALVPLRDPETVEKFAAKAKERELTVQALKEVVQKEIAKTRDDDSTRGRPPTPTIRKMLDRTGKALKLEEGQRITKAMVVDLGDEGIFQAMKDTRTLIEKLEGLEQKLKDWA